MVQVVVGLLSLGIVVFIVGMQAAFPKRKPEVSTLSQSPRRKNLETERKPDSALDNNRENPAAMSMSGGTGTRI